MVSGVMVCVEGGRGLKEVRRKEGGETGVRGGGR